MSVPNNLDWLGGSYILRFNRHAREKYQRAMSLPTVPCPCGAPRSVPESTTYGSLCEDCWVTHNTGIPSEYEGY